MTLRARIFLSMLAILILSSIMLVIAAGLHFKRENTYYHRDRLGRKEEAIKLSINYVLESDGSTFPADTLVRIFDAKICEIADINKLDIIIFNLEGEILISSNPDIFSSYGITEFVPDAFLEQLRSGTDRLLYEHPTDSVHLLLSYSYLLDQSGMPMAIINIPYFQADEIAEEELGDFLVTLGQVYIVLLIGAGLLAYFLSNYITRSLFEMKERIKHIKLSKNNEKLDWAHDDEIGSLIQEYNRMIDELEASAELLARSERESAWRKMARQVAHEIKNPLTPMKLSVQMLERSLDPESPRFKEQLSEFTEAMIEQIDTLSNIAASFSDFAQMPRGKPEILDLRSVAASSVALYNKTKVKLHVPDEPVRVLTDKEHWIRVLNNLINNALQAIPDDRTPQVNVYVESEENWGVLRVKDNGSGVPEDIRSEIFEPSFTTKSSGTGLGLAMVYNIVQMNEGQIELNSLSEVGAEFTIRIPLHKS
jgi:signal transduction histidine kinase